MKQIYSASISKKMKVYEISVYRANWREPRWIRNGVTIFTDNNL